jgi:DNA-damage-inducible protein D
VPDMTVFDDEGFDQSIRRVMVDGVLFLSVVDVVGVLSDAAVARNYWATLKRRLAEDEGFSEVLTKCQQLKLVSTDGKARVTDCADVETMLRIIQSVPSPKAEPIKQWLASVGAERIHEVTGDADQLRKFYRKQGYAEEWINARLENIVTRNDLTTEWHDRGAQPGREYAILTDGLSLGTFGITTGEHKQVKGIGTRASLPDSMTTLELALNSLASATATAIHQAHDSQGFVRLQQNVTEAGNIAGEARLQIEAATGQPVVSPDNAHTLRQGTQPPLLDG